MGRAARSVLFILGVLQVITLVVASERPALAYTDPGSGLLLVQIVSSTLAGALFMLRARLRKLFRVGKTKDVEAPAPQPTVDL